MNIRRIFTAALASTTLLYACSDDESKPKEQFVVEGQSINLKNAAIYLEQDFANGQNIDFRKYVVTDAVFAEDQYVGGSFQLEIYLGGPEEELEAGNFPLFESFSIDDSKAGYIHFENSEEGTSHIEYYVPEDVSNGSPIIVSGGFEDGETMTLKFNGELTYYYFDGEDWTEEDVTGKLYFKGVIEDIRSAGTLTKSAGKLYRNN